ncbi:MAG: MauE/DoxX family redox-associated membrane protein [Actinoplanes sp.]
MIYLQLTCRLLIAGVFLTSFGGKALSRKSFDGFVASVVAARLVPAGTAVPLPKTGLTVGGARQLAVLVLAGEVTVAATLLAFPVGPVWLTAGGFALAAVLLIAFIVLIRSVRRTGRVVACACFGPSATPLGLAHLWRNAVLLTVAVAGIATATSNGAFATGPVLICVAVAGCGVLLAATFVDLISSSPPSPRRVARSGPKGHP